VLHPLKMQESVMVETQIDAGYADRVPLVQSQLQSAISGGQLVVRSKNDTHA
jgi:hypothetical protein